MDQRRKDIKIRLRLDPGVHDLLETAVADRSDQGMTADRMITRILRYYMTRPENEIDPSDLRRVCCGTDPAGGHRGTCRFSAMRGGPDSAAYQALQRMWQGQG